MKHISRSIFGLLATCLIIFGACRRGKAPESIDTVTVAEEIVELDTATPLPIDTVVKDEIKEEEILAHPGSIIPTIEEASPEYAAKLARREETASSWWIRPG